MPQASDEQRKAWGTNGGAGDEKALAFLKTRGWVLTLQYEWVPPTPSHVATKDELGAIWFLIDEWDFGGIARDVGPLDLPWRL